MKTVTWSPNLSKAVRAWKKDDVNNFENITLGLSQKEQYVISSITTQKPQNVTVQGLWN